MESDNTITLNVRRFPKDLSRLLDIEAARRGVSKRALIISKLTQALEKRTG